MSEELEAQAKRQVEAREERTGQGKYYAPATDIYETESELTVVMDMPNAVAGPATVTVALGVRPVRRGVDLPDLDERPGRARLRRSVA